MMEPEILQELDIEALLGNLLEDGATSPEALFANEPHRAILTTRDGRRAFDVLPPKPAASAQVQQAETKTLGGALAPDAPPIIGIDAEWVWVEDRSNQILSYQYAAISGGHGWRGIVTCENGHRLKFDELVGHALEIGVREGQIGRWPDYVIVAAHHTTAEFSTFADLSDIKAEFDGVRKTFVSASGSYRAVYRDRNRNRHKFKIKLIDTQHLTPGGKALAILGRLYGFPKIELPPGAKERMDLLQRDEPGLFERYAIRDAEISAYHAHRMREFNREVRGEYEPPITLGSLGMKVLLSHWEQAGIDHHAVLGTTVLPRRKVYDHKRGRYHTVGGETVRSRHRQIHEDHVTSCFHGGRNEAFVFGVTEDGIWADYDLVGAYPTSMVAFRTPAYDRAYTSLDPTEFTADCLGFALLQFQFPADTRFPCLPVISANEHGLVFPLRGVATVSSPEIALAVSMGADIKIEHGVIVPWADDVRPFEGFVKEAQSRRGSEKGTFIDQLWKELANSIYGKTAQGLRPKMAFSPRSGKSEEVPESQITNPFIAAYTTSLVRAVLGEILDSTPAGRTVVCATTDGFLTNTSRIEIDTSGLLCSLFADLRERLSGDREILEVKHKIKRVLCVKTRCQITVEAIEGERSVLAKGGIWVPREVEDHNQFMLDLFRERTHETKLSVNMLTSLREIYTEECDLVSKSQDRRVNLDPDYKRELIKPEERGGLLFCESCPWRTVENFNTARALFEEWRRDRVLKTLDDWRGWTDYLAGTQASKMGVRRSKGGVVDQARRTFLRAYTRGLWGLPGGDYKAIAEWLTAAGYPTSVSHLKNAKRAKVPVGGAIPLDAPGVAEFVRTVRERFPNFEWPRLVAGRV